MEPFTDELAESWPRLGRCLNIFPTQKDIIDPQTTCFNRKKSFTFTIRGLDKLVDGFIVYSPPFGVGGLMWRILVKVVSVDCDGKLKHHLGFFTSCCSHPYSSNWKATVKATLITITSMNTIFQRRQTEHEYSAKNYDWGYSQFGALDDIRKSCFHDDVFKVRMDIEVIKVEQAQTHHKFINNLIARVDAPMKRLREGYVDEAIQLNNDVLREAKGRNAWVIEKVKWQGLMLNKMKLKQSIKRIERGGIFSPTNDRITVKTALMGVPLPKHLSKQLNLLPKSVRVDMTATRMASPSMPKNSGDHCNETDSCSCELCIDDGIKTLKSSLSATSVKSNSSGEGEEETMEDADYYTPDNSTSTCSDSEEDGIYMAGDCPQPSRASLKFASKPTLSPSFIKEDLFPPTSTRVRMVLSEAATLAKIKYPDLGCDSEELLGHLADGRTGMDGCREMILQTYFCKLLHDEAELPFETFCENLKRDAVKSFEKILVTILDFFKHIMNHVAKLSTIVPPEFHYDHPSYDVATDCLEWIDKCTDTMAEFVELQWKEMDARRVNQILEFRKQQHDILDAVKDRHISMLKIREEALRLQLQLKELFIDVEKHDILIRHYARLQDDRREKSDELVAIFEKREAARAAVMLMNERIEKHKKLFEAVIRDLYPLRKQLTELRTNLKDAYTEVEESVEETATLIDGKMRGLVEVRKQADTIQREKHKILEAWTAAEKEHEAEMRALDRRKLIELCGMAQDEVEEFLESCDDALRYHGRCCDESQSEADRCALRGEIERLREFECYGREALEVIMEHTDECLRLFDAGKNLEDMPEVPVFELPEIEYF